MSDIQWTTKFDSENNIERKVALLLYNDIHIDYVHGSNFINGTMMAKSCGKEIYHWLENVQPAELSYVLAKKNMSPGIPSDLEWKKLLNLQLI